jgi:hypothetical protein
MTTELLSYKALRIGLQNSRSQAYFRQRLARHTGKHKDMEDGLEGFGDPTQGHREAVEILCHACVTAEYPSVH